jgi:chaperone modulatory protein CbpM
MTTTVMLVDLDELCQSVNLPRDVLVEIVEVGIVEPREQRAGHWVFDYQAVSVVRRAVRLRREFELDWPGIALALRLLDEVDELRAENRYLRQRLARLLEE